MRLQILLNLVIAFLWMFFHNHWTFSLFVLGYGVGLVLLFLLRKFFKTPFYMVKVFAAVKLLLIFLRELLASNWAVLKEIIRPRLDIRPGIVAVPTELKSDWEITLLSCLVTLTPGTLTLEVAPERDVLYVHAMNISDAQQLAHEIKHSFEKAIQEVSR